MYVNNKVMATLCITLATSIGHNIDQHRELKSTTRSLLQMRKTVSYLASKMDKAEMTLDMFDQMALKDIFSSK